MALMDDGVIQHRVKIALLGIGGLVAIIHDISNDSNLRRLCAGAAGVTGGIDVIAAADGAGGIRCAGVRVQMQENIAFDPGVGPINVKAVIVAANDDVADELNDGAGALAAGEIHDVTVAVGFSEKVAQEQTVAVGPNTTR